MALPVREEQRSDFVYPVLSCWIALAPNKFYRMKSFSLRPQRPCHPRFAGPALMNFCQVELDDLWCFLSARTGEAILSFFFPFGLL